MDGRAGDGGQMNRQTDGRTDVDVDVDEDGPMHQTGRWIQTDERVWM
jgi:hypothetical protein